MATQKINFTPEHKARLDVLVLAMLFGNLLIKGILGVEYAIQDLLNNITFNSLQNLLAGLKKEVDKIESLDEWSMTPYQQNRLQSVKETAELVNLIIGYRKYQLQISTEKQQIAALKAEMKNLKAQSITPEEKIKLIEAQITSMGGTLADDAEAEPVG